MTDYIETLEQVREEHTLEFMARGLKEVLDPIELKVLVEHLSV